MTSEQLLATRATLWRQKAEPLLTLDDAQSWLSQTGLCLFLPRKAQIPAPAPSFVEACLGQTNPTPPRASIETAKNLLARLIEANSALPLNLLGTASDHPDFLVSIEALPFVYALRGDRDWKHAPGTAGANRVSPLITHVWKLLESRGVLTAGEIQEELGRELTEAAVLRALHELWAALRVIPLYQSDGQQTLWEPLQSRHQKAMSSGVGMSQVTALSVLASVYLQSVVAASSDDAESFLSPLASRSKVREVVRGLTATRQLSLIQMETQSLLYVEGSLPEFPDAEKPVLDAVEAAAKSARRPHPTSPEALEATLRRSVAGSTPRPAYKRPAEGERRPGRPPARSGGSTFRPAAGARPESREREGKSFRPATGGARPAFRSSTSRPSAFRPKSAPIARSEPGTGLRADGSPKRPRWRDMPGGRPDQKGKPARFGPRETEGATGEESSRPAPRREPGEFRPAAGSKPPYQRGSSPREGKPFRPAASGRSFGAGSPTGTFRPSGPGGASRPGRPSFGGSSREGGRSPSRPFNTGRPPIRSNDSRSGSRPPSRSGDRRFTARPEGSRPFSRPRREGGDAPRTPREGAPGDDRKFTPRTPRPGGFSSSRPSSGGARPYSARSGGTERPSAGRPSPGGSSYGKSFSPGRPSSGRPPSDRPPSDRPKTGKSFGDFPARKKPGGSGIGSRPPSRGGFASGSRPGGGRSGPGAGRPKTGFGSKPGGRPPSKFKKRPE